MPIYEYQCAACGRIVEKWQNFSEEPLKVCPHCGGSLSKIISACTFHLKGGGWYVTDYGGAHSASQKTDKSETAKGSDEPAKKGQSEAAPSKTK